MDSEGPGDPSGTDLVVQNRTGSVRHATVRCQTSTSTIFSEMVELESGGTVTSEDLPQELIELQVSVADGPKGSKMYDAETVSGTVAVGVTDTDIQFETTTDAVASVSELDELFDDGGIGGTSAGEDTPQATESSERDADTGADQEPSGNGTPTHGESAAGGTDRGGSDASDRGGSDASDREGADRDGTDARGSTRTDRRSRSADAAGSYGTDASSGADGEATGSDIADETDSDAADGTARGTAEHSDRTAGASDTTTDDAAGMSTADDRGPGPGEIHCRNCGEIIRANAELCPECGTQNMAQTDRRTAGTDNATTAGSDAQSTASGTPAADDPDREPGPDEIYCRNCGEIIREKAEICPECGVGNAAQSAATPSTGSQPAPGQRGGGPTGAAAGATQQTGSAGGTPTQGQSTGSEPSGSWVNGVRFGALLWFLALLILVPTVLRYQSVTASPGLDPGGMMQSLGLAALLPPVQLLAWVVLPLSLYFDLKYVDYHVDEWPLNGRLYIAAAAILPILTQVLGAAALFVGSGGAALAAVVPVALLALSVRHLRTRSRLV